MIAQAMKFSSEPHAPSPMTRSTVTRMRLHALDSRHQMPSIADRGGYVGHIQNEFCLRLRGDCHLETIATRRFALAPVAHLGIGDANDAVRRRACTDLGISVLIGNDVIAQDFGQQPAHGTHLGPVAVCEGHVERGFGIRNQHLELLGSLAWVSPINISFAIFIPVCGDQLAGGV